LKIKESGCQDVILSCEELTNFMMMQYDAVNTGRLRDALFEIDKDVRLVVYVRNPSDFYLSILQEKLKRHAGVLSPETFQTNFSKTIRHYETVFGCKAIVREFHPTKLIESDIVADFLDATGLARVDISNWESVVSNESISPEILLALDLARREEGEVDLHYDFDESEMLWRKTNAIAKELSFSNKPVLFKHVHDRIMESNREDIQTLSERHGISFAQGKFVEGQPSTPKEYQISLIEDLMAVDRQRAIYVWSVFTLRAIKSVFSLRKKVHAQTKFKKV
jgi:hypothetical protein